MGKIKYLNLIIEEAIDKVFVPKDRGKKSKRIIPLSVRKLITKKTKLSKSICKTMCSVQISTLRK